MSRQVIPFFLLLGNTMGMRGGVEDLFSAAQERPLKLG